MMLRTILSAWLAFSLVGSAFAVGWQSKRIHERFYTEGASVGDIDGDGHLDIVAGPLWFRGPDFEESSPIAEPKEFPVSGYSDQFFSSVLDADDNGDPDVLVIGFPGKAARLYLNPGREGLDQPWEMHEVADIVDNESPAVVDLVDGGLPELVCGREGQYGYYQATTDVTAKWTWTPVTRPGACAGRFAHGMGVGDVNNDGRLDLLDKDHWWQQPESLEEKELWQHHSWSPSNYGQGGAQILVFDVDGDDDSDIVTSLNAHGYGLAWFEQTGEGKFTRHDIMGESSVDNDYGVVFSQLHALAMADIDGDGLQDIVTGKRFRAHNGKDPGGLQQPVLYWFQCQRGPDGVEFVPRLIHDDSGVGVEVVVRDLNTDGRPDVISSSKRGLSVHLQDPEGVSFQPQRWRDPEGRNQNDYADGLEPQQAARQMQVPDGFHVDLIASEPELTQPIAMCFDARGRIWVIEGHTYPTKAPKGKGKDRVIILSDDDADGTFETRKTFIEGLNLASGIEVGFGGVWIGAAPHLLFIPDANRDDVPDSDPKVLLDGWGYQDTHETLNSFTWGPDGWLYGCQGVFTHSDVGKVGASPKQRTKMNAGVWRYHPTQHRFEVFAHGTSNPWGVDFNDRGDWFISACVIPHLYHIQQGARYQRQAGQHFNPYTFDDIKTIADHLHYAGNIRDHAYWGDNKQSKPSAPMGTSLVGGGHAHCGLAIYNADQFPAEYYGDLFFHNLHGHRVVRETVADEGSGYVGLHRPDFALARDHKEIGVGVMVGPDGAIYTSDWHDVQTCHNRETEVWDRTDGRLFRVRYGKHRPQAIDLWRESDQQLVMRLQSDNGFIARQAQRVLQERAAEGTLKTSEVVAELDAVLDGDSSQRDRLRALWTRWCIGATPPQELMTLLTDADPYVRGWSVHFIGEYLAAHDDASLEGEWLQSLVQHAKSDPSAVVRRYLASLAQQLSMEARLPILRGLASSAIDSHDRNLPLLVWYALEPLADQQPDQAYQLAKTSPLPNLLRFTVRRIAVSPQGRELLVSRLADASERAQRLLILEELNAAATSRGGVEMPSQWPRAFEQLRDAPMPRVQQLARALAVQFGDAAVYPFFRSILGNPQQPKQKRLEALAALRTAGDQKLPEQIFGLLDDQAIAAEAINALAQFNHPQVAEQLLEKLSTFAPEARSAALTTLVSRADSAKKLVAAMEAERVDPSSVPAYVVRQALTLGDEQLNARLQKSWGSISTTSEEKRALFQKYRQVLRPRAVAAADASRGRMLYEENCGKCHKLFGEGGDIGPEITGANRTDVNYWLENILDPNALIGRAYWVTTFVTDDGRVVNGIVQEENEDAVTVQTATEKLVLPKEQIVGRKKGEVSLMPEGQLEPMSDQQVRDLFKYLTGPSQVPLPSPAP